MQKNDTGTPLDDIAYLIRSEHRAPTLIALTVRPRSRSELWEMTGVSESTIRRTLSEFEEREWVYRDGYQYEATQLGAFVASAMADLIDRVETERKLRDVWRLLPDEETRFTIEMCSDATVTVADPEDPSGPITRFCSLIEETERLRFTELDVAMLDSCKTELCEQIVDGMETELINPPRVANYIRSDCRICSRRYSTAAISMFDYTMSYRRSGSISSTTESQSPDTTARALWLGSWSTPTTRTHASGRNRPSRPTDEKRRFSPSKPTCETILERLDHHRTDWCSSDSCSRRSHWPD